MIRAIGPLNPWRAAAVSLIAVWSIGISTTGHAGARAPAANGDAAYERAFTETMHAIDSGRMHQCLAAAWRRYEKSKTPANAVAVGLASIYADFLCRHQLSAPPAGGIRIDEAQSVVHEAMMHDKDNPYPTLVYAWFVNLFREAGLAPWITKDLGEHEYTINGKKQTVHMDRVLADPAKKKRVAQLVARAAEMDEDNPLLWYFQAGVAEDVAEKKRLLWKSIGRPGERLWEFAALGQLRRLAKGDERELARIRQRAKDAKAVVGESPRAKGNGF